ncbi:MAG: phytanoyl-CoA dioxygenase family protein [Candidatus Latescibacteria bacterium]|nr:phytanoyl-CoA dioxygenase family protein [Candidatus Latescibacterota bacterium]
MQENHARQLKEMFDRDGYRMIRGLLSPAEVEALNAHIDHYIAEVLPQLPPDAAFYEVKGQPETLMRLQKLHEYDGPCGDLLVSERFVRLAEALLDDGAVPVDALLFNKPARVGKRTPPHQDGFYFMLEPNEALTLWLALDPVDEVNGCLRYVRGSHRRGMRPHQRSNVLGFSQGITDFGGADREAEVAICAEPGDTVVHHSMTIHRADPNPSERTRRALGFVYYARRARQDVERLKAYQKNLIAQWSEEGKV